MVGSACSKGARPWRLMEMEAVGHGREKLLLAMDRNMEEGRALSLLQGCRAPWLLAAPCAGEKEGKFPALACCCCEQGGRMVVAAREKWRGGSAK